MKKLISVVVPAFNERDCVDELSSRIRTVFDETLQGRYDFEAIIVENGSQDDTFEKLVAINARDPRFKIVQLARNFNMEGGMCAGLAYATGDAAVIMSADLQDPPELIPRFIDKWEAGYENVYQVVTKRSDTSIFRRIAAAIFYWIINKVSDQPVPRNVSDFRLVDRSLYETFNAMPERNRMVRAMWSWMGFRSCGIEAERPPRFAGTSAFSSIKTGTFAIRAILASSYTPLKIIPLFGFLLAVVSFVVLGGLIIRAFFFGVPFSGFGTIVGLILLLFGCLFLLLGIMSEYIGMILEEVRRRPSFIVRRELGTSREQHRAAQHLLRDSFVEGDDSIAEMKVFAKRR